MSQKMGKRKGGKRRGGGGGGGGSGGGGGPPPRVGSPHPNPDNNKSGVPARFPHADRSLKQSQVCAWSKE